MRLFGKVDGAIDRHDHAFFFGLPFDIELGEISPPGVRVVAAQVFLAGADYGEVFTAGSAASQVFLAGTELGEVSRS